MVIQCLRTRKFQENHCPLLLGFAFTFALLSSTSAWDQGSPIVIKFSHVVTANTPKGLAADYFAKRAAELTGGRVKVQVFPNSSLYKDKEEMEALQVGEVQMLAPSLAKFGPLGVKEFEVFDLPYIFDGQNEARLITHGRVGKELLSKLEPRGIKGLAFWENGFKQFSANTPIRSAADMRGKRFRIQSSRVLEEQMRVVGAIPLPMAFSEVYQALLTGVVDGQENPISNFYTQKMHDVQKHLTISDHGYLGYAVIANKRFWESLPNEVRVQLEVAVKDATHYANSIAAQKNEDDLKGVIASGKTQVYRMSPAEKKAMKKAFLPAHANMEGRIGKDLIQRVYRETSFDPRRF